MFNYFILVIMAQISDFQLKKILKLLKSSPLSAYSIAKNTGITEQTILNYRSGKTVPTAANAKLLEYFFNDCSVASPKKNSENSVYGNSNIIGDYSNINNSHDDCHNLDFLYKQIELLSAQLREKDLQIKELLDIVNNLSKNS